MPPKETKQESLEAKVDELLAEVRKLRDELKIFKLNFQQTVMMGRK